MRIYCAEEGKVAKSKTGLVQKVLRGKKMPKGKGWRITNPKDSRRFKATLIKTFKIGEERIAIFRVWPTPGKN